MMASCTRRFACCCLLALLIGCAAAPASADVPSVLAPVGSAASLNVNVNVAAPAAGAGIDAKNSPAKPAAAAAAVAEQQPSAVIPSPSVAREGSGEGLDRELDALSAAPVNEAATLVGDRVNGISAQSLEGGFSAEGFLVTPFSRSPAVMHASVKDRRLMITTGASQGRYLLADWNGAGAGSAKPRAYMCTGRGMPASDDPQAQDCATFDLVPGTAFPTLKQLLSSPPSPRQQGANAGAGDWLGAAFQRVRAFRVHGDKIAAKPEGGSAAANNNQPGKSKNSKDVGDYFVLSGEDGTKVVFELAKVIPPAWKGTLQRTGTQHTDTPWQAGVTTAAAGAAPASQAAAAQSLVETGAKLNAKAAGAKTVISKTNGHYVMNQKIFANFHWTGSVFDQTQEEYDVALKKCQDAGVDGCKPKLADWIWGTVFRRYGYNCGDGWPVGRGSPDKILSPVDQCCYWHDKESVWNPYGPKVQVDFWKNLANLKLADSYTGAECFLAQCMACAWVDPDNKDESKALDYHRLGTGLSVAGLLKGCTLKCQPIAETPKVVDCGYADLPRGWYDVSMQGAKHDYCRFVGNSRDRFACMLAGSNEPYTDVPKGLAKECDKNDGDVWNSGNKRTDEQCVYNDDCQPKQRADKIIDCGYPNMRRGWYLDGNGHFNDYCRWVGDGDNLMFRCMKAGSSEPYSEGHSDTDPHEDFTPGTHGC